MINILLTKEINGLSIIQAVGSAIIYYIAAPALDKVKFKTKLS